MAAMKRAGIAERVRRDTRHRAASPFVVID
jgi:hypothetical protein